MAGLPPPLALVGRVVTMDEQRRVLPRGVVYIADGRIAAVQPVQVPAPPGFEAIPRLQTCGTIYPGLIELHNHLAYNILPRWNVPRRYTSRSHWGQHPDYRKLISGPLSILGKIGTLPAIVRYTEAKCLVSGTTTSQGIALFSNAGTARAYQGIVRNVETPDADDLPKALTRIADVEAADVEAFWKRLQRVSCLLLHLSEGTDEATRKTFLSLQRADGSWAISKALAGIHAVALKPEDIAILAAHEGAVIWSPTSNLTLYGQTADLAAWKQHSVRVGLGADWSPSGSKNLLAELKLARLVNQLQGTVYTDRELVEMATLNAASILGWQGRLGTLQPGAHADLIVVPGTRGDPYAQLLEAAETDLSLVIIGGIRRFGLARLMPSFEVGMERTLIRQLPRVLDLRGAADPDVAVHLSLRDAAAQLRDSLRRLPELAGKLERGEILGAGSDGWELLLDEEDPSGQAVRPYFDEGAVLGTAWDEVLGGAPLSELLQPVSLDPLTVADDADYVEDLMMQQNLPAGVRERLSELYGARS
jgi:5-methylthioadenosine/S-adenosylhomocysteine deaminase